MSLLDPVSLAAWLDAEGLEVGAELAIEPLGGGTSNAMFRVDRGLARWVLRRPAVVAVERADEGMRREFRLLTALERTDVPHPTPIALCDDHAVLGCTFFLMQRVEGVNALVLPPGLDDDDGHAEVAFAMIDALARLHAVDWRAAGLADLGRPDGFHERQVSRWSKQLRSYDGRQLPGIDRVMGWLEDNRPGSFDPTIMHADYHMLNVLIAPDRPGRVVAILDWETSTIGDPLLDLAGFCEIWCGSDSTRPLRRSELVEQYAMLRELESVPDLRYYEVLYNFRLAVLVEGIYQRSLLDETRANQDSVGERVLVNVRRALELVDGAGADGPALSKSHLPSRDRPTGATSPNLAEFGDHVLITTRPDAPRRFDRLPRRKS